MATPHRRADPVEVVAHRGASSDESEHTMAAYRHAIRLGADAVECDVRMTRDGVLVCVHDRRIDRTSTGRGVVSSLDLADLERFEFGRSAAVSERGVVQLSPGRSVDDTPDGDAGRVLTLERLLEYVTNTPGRVRLAIETKHPTRHSGHVESALVELLRRFGLLTHGRPIEWAGRSAVRVMSFSPSALRRVHALAPGLPTVQLLRQLPPWGSTTTSRSVATAIGPSLALVRRLPWLVRRAQETGTEVHVWTVNELQDMHYVLSLGVDAVITDHPGTLLSQLGRDCHERRRKVE